MKLARRTTLPRVLSPDSAGSVNVAGQEDEDQDTNVVANEPPGPGELLGPDGQTMPHLGVPPIIIFVIVLLSQCVAVCSSQVLLCRPGTPKMMTRMMMHQSVPVETVAMMPRWFPRMKLARLATIFLNAMRVRRQEYGGPPSVTQLCVSV